MCLVYVVPSSINTCKIIYSWKRIGKRYIVLTSLQQPKPTWGDHESQRGLRRSGMGAAGMGLLSARLRQQERETERERRRRTCDPQPEISAPAIDQAHDLLDWNAICCNWMCRRFFAL